MSKPIFLEWTVNAVNQVEQRIYRTIDDLPETPLVVVGPTVTSYEDTDATTLATASVTYRVESVGRYRGEETRASSLTTTVTIENDPPGLIADPYTFKVATNSLTMSSTQPFYVKIGDTKVSAESSGATYSLSHDVSDLEQPIRVYSENTPSGYDAPITVTSPVSEIVSWSEFDWGVGGVGVKPNLSQLIKVPETAPITTSYQTLFSGAVNFNDPSVSLWTTTGVTNMLGVFQNCQKFNQPLSNWSTAGVTTMRGMFDRCFTFNQPVDHFDVSLVQDFGWMFNACQVFNQPLTSWNTAGAKDMGGMFRVAAKFDQPIGHFTTTNVTNFADMFSGASIFNQDISGWDTANVTTMSGMFFNAEKFHQDISGWNVAKVANMKEMFYGANAFDYSLTGWCVSLISTIPDGFATGATNFTNEEHPVWGTCPVGENIPENVLYFTTTSGGITYRGKPNDRIILNDGTIVDIYNENVGGVTVPAGKHKFEFSLERTGDPLLPVSLGGKALVEVHNFPTLNEINYVSFFTNEGSPNLIKVPAVLPPNIHNLQDMFSGASKFNQDISGWDTSNVTNMRGIFGGATLFNQPLDSWNTSNVSSMAVMFFNATNFNQPIGSWNVGNVTDMESMFWGARNFNQPIANWNVSKVESMRVMFAQCEKLDQDLSQWCVPLITSLPPDFVYGAPAMTAEKLPVWGTCPRGENVVSPEPEPTVTAPEVSMGLLMVTGADEGSQLNVYVDDQLINGYNVGTDFEHAAGLVQREVLQTTTLALVGVKQMNGFMIRNLNASNEYDLRLELVGAGALMLMDLQMSPVTGETVTPTDIRIRTVSAHPEMNGGLMVAEGNVVTYEPRNVNFTIGLRTGGEFDFTKDYTESFNTYDLYRDMVAAMNTNLGATTAALTTDASLPDAHFDLIKDEAVFDGVKMVFAGNASNQTLIRFAQNVGDEFNYFYLRKPDSKQGQSYDDLDVLFPNTSMAAVIEGTF